MAAVTKDENKAPAVDPKLTAKKVNKRNPKGTTAECLSVFTRLGHFIVIDCFCMAQLSAFAVLDFFSLFFSACWVVSVFAYCTES